MEQPRITINLSEYEELKRTIQKKDEYIQECVVNGKIKINEVEKLLFFRDLGSYRRDWFSAFPILESESYENCNYFNEIKDERLKAATSEIVKYKKQWEDDYNLKVESVKAARESMLNKTFWERLVYLFDEKVFNKE